jgi:predicted PurR-regulated permease PerM
MELNAAEAKLGGEGDDDIESERVTSRTRLRIAELLQRPFDVRSLALTGLFILAIFYTVYFLRSVLLPIVLAWLLSYLLRPIVCALARIKIATLLGAAFILITVLSAITLSVSALATPAVGWLAKAPAGLQELQYKLIPMKRSMAEVAAKPPPHPFGEGER